MAVFKECSQLLKSGELPSLEYYEELVRRVVYPLISIYIYKNFRERLCSQVEGRDHCCVEARLPSYIRQATANFSLPPPAPRVIPRSSTFPLLLQLMLDFLFMEQLKDWALNIPVLVVGRADTLY